MNDDLMIHLGPLAALAGVWEGDKGDDVAPSDDRGTERNKFRERMTFEPFGPTRNHEQTLYGLRYSTVARRIGEDAPFHEETGYWLWDPDAKQVLRCFIVPRGVTVLDGERSSPMRRRLRSRQTQGRTHTASARTSSSIGSSKPSAMD